jgi:hypothetical protein
MRMVSSRMTSSGRIAGASALTTAAGVEFRPIRLVRPYDGNGRAYSVKRFRYVVDGAGGFDGY